MDDLRGLLASIGLLMLLSGPASADTLAEAMARAYLNNPDLSAARATLRAANELAPQALSNYRPSVSAELGLGATVQDADGLGSDRYISKSAALSVAQPLYRGGRTAAAVRQADSTIAAQEARLFDMEQTILLLTAQAYLDVRRDQAVLDLNRNNEAVLGRQFQAARDRFEVGEVTRTDVSQSQARRSGAISNRAQAEGNLAQSRATYRRVTGEPPGALAPPPPVAGLPDSLEEMISQARRRNPAVRAAASTRQAAGAALAGVKGERLPTVTLQGVAQRDYDGASTFIASERTDAVTARLALNWPLYTAGSTSSRIRQARQNVMQRNDEVESAARGVVEQATQAWEQLQTARAVIEARRAQVNAAQLALEGVEQEAIAGARTVLDALDAEQEAVNAKVALVQAERDETLARYQVLAAVGRLTARDLALPVALYDEKAYAKKVRHKVIGSTVE